jgi:hypothetical protein
MPPPIRMVFSKSFQKTNTSTMPLPAPIQPQQLANRSISSRGMSMNILGADAQKKGCRSCGGK